MVNICEGVMGKRGAGRLGGCVISKTRFARLKRMSKIKLRERERWASLCRKGKFTLMKKIITALFICCVAGNLMAADSSWMTSLPEAKAKAEKEKKLLFLDFAGRIGAAGARNWMPKFSPSRNLPNTPRRIWCWWKSTFPIPRPRLLN